MKEIIGDILLIAFGIILLIHFILFWTVGWIHIGESNSAILAVETIMAVVIIAFGIERFFDDVRNHGH